MEEPRTATGGSRHHVVAQVPELRVVEYTLDPGARHPWHHHTAVTDHIYCLEGLIDVKLRESGQTTLLRPGEACQVPPGTIHRAGNAASAVSRYLLVQGLGKYDFVTDR